MISRGNVISCTCTCIYTTSCYYYTGSQTTVCETHDIGVQCTLLVPNPYQSFDEKGCDEEDEDKSDGEVCSKEN